MSEYKHPEVLVTTEWVAQNLNAPNTRLVEVDVDTTAYDQGHIPGAVGWNWQTQLQDNIRRDLIDRATLEKLLGESGISNDTTILLYGDNNNWFAAYAFWQLKYYGHRNVKLINGGRKKWLEEKRTLTKDAVKVSPATYRVTSTDESVRAFKEDVLAIAQGKKRGQLVDVRSVDEFTGKIIAPPGMTETAQRAGHIPSAANIPWAQAANEDGTFKSADALAALYLNKGVTGSDEVIAYCRIGERSSHTWFVLKYLLGYNNVRNYDGSWTEWGNLIGSPIVNETALCTEARSPSGKAKVCKTFIGGSIPPRASNIFLGFLRHCGIRMRSHCIRHARELHQHHRASPRCALDRHRAAMVADDLADDRQPQPGPIRLA